MTVDAKEVDIDLLEQPDWIKKINQRSGEVLTEEEHLTEIKESVQFASKMTGVRKEFLMGMLVVESNLGRNTGKCTYAEVRADAKRDHESGQLSEGAWQTFQRREEIMKELARDIGRDYGEMTVSCNPPYHGTGGAMGIPQFMPDTWVEYRDRISDVTGSADPDPWNIRDGVVAMALKVSDVPGVTDHDTWAERKASKLYLSGSTSYRYNWYASKIQYWAQNYEHLIG